MQTPNSIEAVTLEAFSIASADAGTTTPALLFADNRHAYRCVFAIIDQATEGRLSQRYAPEGFYFRPIADLLAAAKENS